MIRKATIIFCGNEHGTGDITFPDMFAMDTSQLVQEHFLLPKNARELRKEAKKAGWSVINGEDFCPACSEEAVNPDYTSEFVAESAEGEGDGL